MATRSAGTALVVLVLSGLCPREQRTSALACAAAALVLAALWRRRSAPRPATEADAKAAASEAWDYILVGGGTAGCLLANRLTAGTGKRVLVLEAGSGNYGDKRIQIPTGVLETFQSEEFDWNFRTQSESGLDGKEVYICRGKVLGGSSCLNVLLYNRGDARDYDLWESAFGCRRWSSKDVLAYFRRTQDDKTGLAASDPEHHGSGGEWSVDHVRYQNPLSRCFLQACTSAGLKANGDFNSWKTPQEGAGRFTVSERDGARCSSASALLEPASADRRRSLTVLCGVAAERVEFDAAKRAMGVRFAVAGGRHLARLAPGGEVILAAGAIHSPQLLMLSGVGPAAHLAEHGISAVSPLQGVGENLQDHPAANVSYECPASKVGISPTSHCFFVGGRKLPHPLWVLRWFLTGHGPLTSPGCDHGGFFRTSAAESESPDLQLRFLPARAVTPDGMNSFAKFRETRDLPDGFTLQCIAARPHSRGRVRLASASAADKPLIEGGYLQDGRDLATLREGLRLARSIAGQKDFAEYRRCEKFPGPALQTDAELDEYIRSTVHTANACVGTCRMGSAGDPLAVCDEELRVLGVSGLRVCDASVMPKLPGGQSGAATVMIAERAAELILRA